MDEGIGWGLLPNKDDDDEVDNVDDIRKDWKWSGTEVINITEFCKKLQFTPVLHYTVYV
jgi:hypothetical protein